MESKETSELILVMHNIRSAQNVGALFRTADGAGVVRIILSGYTPAPHANSLGIASGQVLLSKAEKALAKTALGAEKNIPWKRGSSLGKTLTALKQEGFTVIGLEQDERSTDYREYQAHSSVALVVGNEVRGLDKRVINQCDAVMEIPMRGKKNSLNVAVAASIALYQIASTMERKTTNRNTEI